MFFGRRLSKRLTAVAVILVSTSSFWWAVESFLDVKLAVSRNTTSASRWAWEVAHNAILFRDEPCWNDTAINSKTTRIYFWSLQRRRLDETASSTEAKKGGEGGFVGDGGGAFSGDRGGASLRFWGDRSAIWFVSSSTTVRKWTQEIRTTEMRVIITAKSYWVSCKVKLRGTSRHLKVRTDLKFRMLVALVPVLAGSHGLTIHLPAIDQNSDNTVLVLWDDSSLRWYLFFARSSTLSDLWWLFLTPRFDPSGFHRVKIWWFRRVKTEPSRAPVEVHAKMYQQSPGHWSIITNQRSICGKVTLV